MKIQENKLIIIIFLVIFFALVALVFFAYPVIKERYFTKDDIYSTTGNNSNDSLPEQKGSASSNHESKEIYEDDTLSEEDALIPEEETTTFSKIEKEDCTNGCASFEKNKEKEYCLKVCNTDNETGDIEECSRKEGLEKDFCYKILGIEKKDFQECKKITDSNIRESCINTVAEKILERKDPIEE